MNWSSTGFQNIFELKPTGVHALNVFQPLKNSNRLGFMLGNSWSPPSFYVPVAPRNPLSYVPPNQIFRVNWLRTMCILLINSHKLSEIRSSV